MVVLRTESLEADIRRLTHTELDEHRYGGTVQEIPSHRKCDLAVLDRRTRGTVALLRGRRTAVSCGWKPLNLKFLAHDSKILILHAWCHTTMVSAARAAR